MSIAARTLSERRRPYAADTRHARSKKLAAPDVLELHKIKRILGTIDGLDSKLAMLIRDALQILACRCGQAGDAAAAAPPPRSLGEAISHIDGSSSSR